jgi:hypothetical protein
LEAIDRTDDDGVELSNRAEPCRKFPEAGPVEIEGGVAPAGRTSYDGRPRGIEEMA